MDLSKISVKVRPRTPYEAIDLGCVMARQWYLPLVSLWLIWALPVMAISYLIFYDQPWWALLLVWWLKPLFESLQLKYVSEKLFDDSVSWKRLLSDSHTILLRGVFSKLITHRLAFSRSFDMPVSELEGLTGKTRRRRLQTMHRDGNAAGFWLTMIGHGVETTFVFAVFSLAWMLIPMQMSIDFSLQKLLDSALLFPTITLSGFVAMTVVAPFYVCSGFMLYINRRTWLEAWDVELAFRQMANEYSKSGKSVLSVLIIFMAALYTIVGPGPAFANSPEQSRDQIIEILEGDDYHDWHSKQAWRLKKSGPEKEETHWLENFIDWLQEWKADLKDTNSFIAVLMKLLEGLLWLGLAGFIIYLINRYKHFIVPALEQKPRQSQLPEGRFFGLDLSPNAFDNQVIPVATDYWQSGNHREALSHMYRAALSYLIYERRLPLQSSQTEAECIRLCELNEPQFRSHYFRNLTQHWINLAYAHKLLSAEDFSTLCDDWSRFSTQGQVVDHG